jgi:hypothetical protein
MSRKHLYVLKVALIEDKKTWRRIEILGSQSLDVLHEAIFEAFDRMDPHLYSFYLTPPGSKARNRFALAKEYTHPLMLEEGMMLSAKKLHDASQTPLAALNLEKGSTFEYVFDFGDDWQHIITVEDMLDIFPKKKYPRITKKNGVSPPQYPDLADDDEFYDEGAIDFQRMENCALLEKFRNYLERKKYSKKTVEKHLTNINFYINEFLLYEEIITPQEGIYHVNRFLGDWFIRKALWSSKNYIKQYITSLKHFYTFLTQLGEVEDWALDELKKEIREHKDDWLATMQKYDDAAGGLW